MSMSPSTKQLDQVPTVCLAGGSTPAPWVFKTGNERLVLMLGTLVLETRRRILTWYRTAAWVGILLAASRLCVPRLTTFSLSLGIRGCFDGKPRKGRAVSFSELSLLPKASPELRSRGHLGSIASAVLHCTAGPVTLVLPGVSFAVPTRLRPPVLSPEQNVVLRSSRRAEYRPELQRENLLRFAEFPQGKFLGLVDSWDPPFSIKANLEGPG